MLLAEGGRADAVFASHPPLEERIRRIYGRNMGPLAVPEAPGAGTSAVF
jgi:hypothetical protein